MSILTDADLAELRAIEEGEMVDTCRVTEPGTGEKVLNKTTMQYEYPARVVVYEGKCQLVDPATSTGASPEAAERELTLERVRLRVPFAGTTGIRRTHLVEIVAATLDPALAGRVLRIVTNPPVRTRATRREFLLEAAS